MKFSFSQLSHTLNPFARHTAPDAPLLANAARPASSHPAHLLPDSASNSHVEGSEQPRRAGDASAARRLRGQFPQQADEIQQQRVVAFGNRPRPESEEQQAQREIKTALETFMPEKFVSPGPVGEISNNVYIDHFAQRLARAYTAIGHDRREALRQFVVTADLIRRTNTGLVRNTREILIGALNTMPSKYMSKIVGLADEIDHLPPDLRSSAVKWLGALATYLPAQASNTFDGAPSTVNGKRIFSTKLAEYCHVHYQNAGLSDTKKEVSLAAERLVTAIKSHTAGTLPDDVANAIIKAIKSQRQYYHRREAGQVRNILGRKMRKASPPERDIESAFRSWANSEQNRRLDAPLNIPDSAA